MVLSAHIYELRNIILHSVSVEVIYHYDGIMAKSNTLMVFSSDECSTSNDKPPTHKKPQDSRNQPNKDQKKQKRQALSEKWQ